MLHAPVAILGEKEAFLDGLLVLLRRVVHVLAHGTFELDHVVL
jgi:hypothetical protein